ncbi:ABC transporter substrate-binding protein [Angustibacter luteus]|uniref:ABC transporter substrate-binding protein n=1 Tax=Angustibacter luteus TaxID=658456 RepID=A0ABW1JB78_9ACTN
MRTRLTALASLAVLALAAAACSPSSSGDDSADSGGKTTVTVRIWDDQVQKSYAESFAAFTKANPDITVKINLVPYADYFTKLPLDVSSGDIDDIFWLNSSPFGQLADSGALMNIDKALPDEKSGWVKAAVDQYSRNGTLYGVPALTDGRTVVYYNKKLLSAAGVDPSKLTWNPSDPASDSYLAAAKKLTKDSKGRTADQPGFDGKKLAQYGTNIANDLGAIYYNFIGSNGGKFQAEDGSFVFSQDAKSAQAMAYLVKLINADHVAPSAADTNDNGDFSRDKFIQGKLALFESGTYNLKNVADGAQFDWGIAPMPAGPAGRVSVVNSVIAAGNAKTKHEDATVKVLKWLGSTEGASYVGKSGAALPAVTAAQQSYYDYWKKEDVDTAQFGEASGSATIEPPFGPKFLDANNAYNPIFKEIFAGRTPVDSGLKKAQDAANAASK